MWGSFSCGCVTVLSFLSQITYWMLSVVLEETSAFMIFLDGTKKKLACGMYAVLY